MISANERSRLPTLTDGVLFGIGILILDFLA
jgi:hypothetical protein